MHLALFVIISHQEFKCCLFINLESYIIKIGLLSVLSLSILELTLFTTPISAKKQLPGSEFHIGIMLLLLLLLQLCCLKIMHMLWPVRTGYCHCHMWLHCLMMSIMRQTTSLIPRTIFILGQILWVLYVINLLKFKWVFPPLYAWLYLALQSRWLRCSCSLTCQNGF